MDGKQEINLFSFILVVSLLSYKNKDEQLESMQTCNGGGGGTPKFVK